MAIPFLFSYPKIVEELPDLLDAPPHSFIKPRPRLTLEFGYCEDAARFAVERYHRNFAVADGARITQDGSRVTIEAAGDDAPIGTCYWSA